MQYDTDLRFLRVSSCFILSNLTESHPILSDFIFNTFYRIAFYPSELYCTLRYLQLGISSLLLAVELNREEVAFKLIESGADLLAKNKRQYTPLHLAISSAFFDIAVKLLEAGASLHSKEWRNNKPFDLFATESLKRRFFMEADFPNRALVNNNHDLWFYLIQLSDMKVSGW